MKAQSDLNEILKFCHYMFGLKKVLRFKGSPFLSDLKIDRWDSVAEHSYRMALLAIMLAPYLKTKIDLLKTLKITLIHDIVELKANDSNPFIKTGKQGGHAFDKKSFLDKYERETLAAKKIFAQLPKKVGQEFNELFLEYINSKAEPSLATPEGKFAYALDKIEAVIQIIDWRKAQKNWPKENFTKSMQYLFEWSSFDPGLKMFSNLLADEGRLLT